MLLNRELMQEARAVKKATEGYIGIRQQINSAYMVVITIGIAFWIIIIAVIKGALK